MNTNDMDDRVLFDEACRLSGLALVPDNFSRREYENMVNDFRRVAEARRRAS